jgi:hypothetical protein
MNSMFWGDFVVSLFHTVSLCCFGKKIALCVILSVCIFVCMKTPQKYTIYKIYASTISFSSILHTLYCVASSLRHYYIDVLEIHSETNETSLYL